MPILRFFSPRIPYVYGIIINDNFFEYWQKNVNLKIGSINKMISKTYKIN